MKWNNDILEEDYMFISQWNCKSTDNTCKNIQEFRSTIELMIFMNKSKKGFVHRFSNHFSSWDKLSIKLMQNIL